MSFQRMSQPMIKNILLLLVCATTLVAPVSAPCQSAPEIVIDHGVAMKTRDGVTLRADVYRRAGDGKYPVLLQRTPYNKDSSVDFARRAAADGFLVVIQDARGRYSSEGEWYPFKHETDDGYDTVEWAAQLPHSNGKVGMFGGSYVGATQMLAAIADPPHLAGICPEVTASNYHENWTYQGGALDQWFDESWTSQLAQDTFNRIIHEDTNALVASATVPLNKYTVFNWRAPGDGASLTQGLAPYFFDWLAHPLYDGYWKKWSIEENYDKIKVPVMVMAAWYDVFQGGSLRNFIGNKAQHEKGGGIPPRLVIKIGGHAGGERTFGTVDFGPTAGQNDWDDVILAWYGYLLQGKQNEFAGRKPIRMFVMGEDQWRDEDAWPLARARLTHFFLHSSGNSNTISGDGSLSTTAAVISEAEDKYIYDPANPVPTTGGPLCCDNQHLVAGPRDQRAVERRTDVLVYSTPALDKDVEVTGPVTLDLYAISSAADTDFTAKLVDVGPDGFARNLTEGILRARYRQSTSAADPILPGKVYEYKIDLWSTGNVFLRGHRIRLEVSSSNFPRFDRNLNTGKDNATDSTMVKATNTVVHDADHPSALILPLVPR
jgi:putative CocE/NonD family hydrolase